MSWRNTRLEILSKVMSLPFGLGTPLWFQRSYFHYRTNAAATQADLASLIDQFDSLVAGKFIHCHGYFVRSVWILSFNFPTTDIINDGKLIDYIGIPGIAEMPPGVAYFIRRRTPGGKKRDRGKIYISPGSSNFIQDVPEWTVKTTGTLLNDLCDALMTPITLPSGAVATLHLNHRNPGPDGTIEQVNEVTVGPYLAVMKSRRQTTNLP